MRLRFIAMMRPSSLLPAILIVACFLSGWQLAAAARKKRKLRAHEYAVSTDFDVYRQLPREPPVEAVQAHQSLKLGRFAPMSEDVALFAVARAMGPYISRDDPTATALSTALWRHTVGAWEQGSTACEAGWGGISCSASGHVIVVKLMAVDPDVVSSQQAAAFSLQLLDVVKCFFCCCRCTLASFPSQIRMWCFV